MPAKGKKNSAQHKGGKQQQQQQQQQPQQQQQEQKRSSSRPPLPLSPRVSIVSGTATNESLPKTTPLKGDNSNTQPAIGGGDSLAGYASTTATTVGTTDADCCQLTSPIPVVSASSVGTLSVASPTSGGGMGGGMDGEEGMGDDEEEASLAASSEEHGGGSGSISTPVAANAAATPTTASTQSSSLLVPTAASTAKAITDMQSLVNAIHCGVFGGGGVSGGLGMVSAAATASHDDGANISSTADGANIPTASLSSPTTTHSLAIGDEVHAILTRMSESLAKESARLQKQRRQWLASHGVRSAAAAPQEEEEGANAGHPRVDVAHPITSGNGNGNDAANHSFAVDTTDHAGADRPSTPILVPTQEWQSPQASPSPMRQRVRGDDDEGRDDEDTAAHNETATTGNNEDGKIAAVGMHNGKGPGGMRLVNAAEKKGGVRQKRAKSNGAAVMALADGGNSSRQRTKSVSEGVPHQNSTISDRTRSTTTSASASGKMSSRASSAVVKALNSPSRQLSRAGEAAAGEKKGGGGNNTILSPRTPRRKSEATASAAPLLTSPTSARKLSYSANNNTTATTANGQQAASPTRGTAGSGARKGGAIFVGHRNASSLTGKRSALPPTTTTTSSSANNATNNKESTSVLVRLKRHTTSSQQLAWSRLVNAVEGQTVTTSASSTHTTTAPHESPSSPSRQGSPRGGNASSPSRPVTARSVASTPPSAAAGVAPAVTNTSSSTSSSSLATSTRSRLTPYSSLLTRNDLKLLSLATIRKLCVHYTAMGALLEGDEEEIALYWARARGAVPAGGGSNPLFPGSDGCSGGFSP